MPHTIYIRMLDEGTNVWRPVSAKRVDGDVYRIIGPPPDDSERWEFTTGETVRCREQSFEGGEKVLVADERYAV